MQIDLSLEDIALLTELLRGELGSLREEIHNTDDHSFKAKLQGRKKLMENLLAKLGSSDVAETA